MREIRDILRQMKAEDRVRIIDQGIADNDAVATVALNSLHRMIGMPPLELEFRRATWQRTHHAAELRGLADAASGHVAWPWSLLCGVRIFPILPLYTGG